MKSDRNEVHWLEDIRTAIEEIETHPKFAEGRDAFVEDKYFRGWCYLQIARISETCVHLADDYNYKKKHPDVLLWKDIRGARIILVHKYWNIDEDIIWNTVEKDLPFLKEKVGLWIEDKARQHDAG